jgi:hypothetical protein
MAKDRIGLKNSLGLSPKMELKKTEVDVEKTEILTKNIHEQVAKKNNVKVRLSTDVSEELYEKFQNKLFKEKKIRNTKKISGQQIIRELIEIYVASN